MRDGGFDARTPPPPCTPLVQLVGVCDVAGGLDARTRCCRRSPCSWGLGVYDVGAVAVDIL
jgi:hypothetical protein